MRVPIQREPDALDLPLPEYAMEGSAGVDLRAAVTDSVILPPGGRAKISAGIRLALPAGYEAQVRPRSGLADKHGVGLVNSPGTIDETFRGVLHVLLINWGNSPFTVRRGDRIAQLVVAPVTRVEWQEAQEALPTTTRGEGGFGHTGIE
ncbi:MAG: dUTP diphosphatase [Armatimonadota bacterium]|nr:dUTP diphosphatase [Armatimonadota bacterium]